MNLNTLLFGGSNVLPFIHPKTAGDLAVERAEKLGYRGRVFLANLRRAANNAARKGENPQAAANRLVGHPQESAVVGHGPEAA